MIERIAPPALVGATPGGVIGAARMPSERIQRRIDQLLDRAEAAIDALDWGLAKQLCEQVLTLDADNTDGPALLKVAERGMADRRGSGVGGDAGADQPP